MTSNGHYVRTLDDPNNERTTTFSYEVTDNLKMFGK